MSKDGKYFVKLELGDVSNDGHGLYTEKRYVSNYPADAIWEAYEKSCDETMIQFSRNCTNKPRFEVFTEYQDNCIDEDVAEVLRDNGINPKDYCCCVTSECGDAYSIYHFEPDGAAKLIMKFIGLNMPCDWVYEEVTDEYETINKRQIGYGLMS